MINGAGILRVLIRKFSFIFYISISIFLPQARAGSDVVDFLLKQDLDLFYHLNDQDDHQCKVSDLPLIDPLPMILKSTQTSMNDFLSEQKCSDLLSPNAPDWILSNLLSVNGPFQVPFFTSQTWTPLCSMTELYKQQSKGLTLEKLDEHMQIYDVCGKSSDRYNSDYVSPTMKSLDVRVMSETEWNTQVKRTKEVIEEVATNCCSRLVNDMEKSDVLTVTQKSQCYTSMRNTQILKCNVKAKDNISPEPCINSGTYSNYTSSSLAEYSDFFKRNDKVLKKDINLSTFPIASSYISLAPFTRNQDGAAKVTMSTIAHELGHVCSNTIQSIRIHSGQIPANREDALNAFDSFRDKRFIRATKGIGPAVCQIDQGIEDVFWYNFTAAGMKDRETFDCIEGEAQNMKKNIFSLDNNGTPMSCDKGCPYSGMEEAFADWTATKYVLESNSSNYSINYFDDFSCSTIKDALHPLRRLLFKCFSMERKIQDEFMEKSKCKK